MTDKTDFPRERLVMFGAQALSDRELLAILLRTGTRAVTVFELVEQLLQTFPNLYELKSASLVELQQIKGIGLTRAVELSATLELGVRIQKAMQPKLGKVYSSKRLAEQLLVELQDCAQEHLLCMYLNTKNQIIQKRTLFIGSLNQSIAHPREIFRYAVRCSAARIVVAHNHPSGDPRPSENDYQFTYRLKECGMLMGIDVLDHIITGHQTYISLREEGFWDK